MPAGILGKAVEEFELATDDVTSGFEFVRAAARLRPRLNEMLNWAAMDSDAKKLASKFLNQRGEQESLIYRGFVIALCGAFEQFVRRIVNDAVSAINEAAENYDELGDAITTQNAYRTGIALQTIFEPPDHLELDYESLAKNIGTCFIGSTKPVLNANAFAIFLSVLSPEKLGEAFKRIGVKLDWDALGRTQAVRDALEKSATRETTRALQDFLKRFGQIRNKIAHSGSSGIVVTETDFEQFVALFRSLAPALASVVETQLSKSMPA